MKKDKLDRVSRVVGLGAVALGGIMLLPSYSMGLGTVKLPGAGAWPFLLSICLLLVGAKLFFRPGLSQQKATVLPARWGSFTVAVITLFGYALLLDPLGYLVDTALLLLVQLHWVEGRNWKVSFIIAFIGAIVSFAVFGLWLKVPLPSGIIPIRAG